MSNDRVTAGYGLTRNLGDFNSLRLDAQVESDVREGETVEEAWKRTFKQAEEEIAAQLEAFNEG